MGMIQVKIGSGQNGSLAGLGLEADHSHDDARSLLWIDLDDPSQAEIDRIGQEFGLHPLALEDASRGHERPKIDIYENFIFIIFYVLEMEQNEIRTREISLFAGRDYMITVHDGALAVIDETARRWNDAVLRQPGQESVGLLVYSLLDAIVDGYFPVIDDLADQVEDFELAIFSGDGELPFNDLFAMKKQLLAVRRVVAPERDVMNVLVRRDAPLFNKTEITYMQDVYDHLLRVTDSVDSYRELLSSALDASVAMASFRLDDTVKRMTSASIILMSMALISGIYGMNFVNMPELGWVWGYAFALGLMVVVGGGLGWFFHRIDWL
jgi:magnesium transporter